MRLQSLECACASCRTVLGFESGQAIGSLQPAHSEPVEPREWTVGSDSRTGRFPIHRRAERPADSKIDGPPVSPRGCYFRAIDPGLPGLPDRRGPPGHCRLSVPSQCGANRPFGCLTGLFIFPARLFYPTTTQAGEAIRREVPSMVQYVLGNHYYLLPLPTSISLYPCPCGVRKFSRLTNITIPQLQP